MDENQYSALIGVAVTFYIFGIIFLFIGYGVFIFIKCHQWNYHSKLLSDIYIELTNHIVHLLSAFLLKATLVYSLIPMLFTVIALALWISYASLPNGK